MSNTPGESLAPDSPAWNKLTMVGVRGNQDGSWHDMNARRPRPGISGSRRWERECVRISEIGRVDYFAFDIRVAFIVSLHKYVHILYLFGQFAQTWAFFLPKMAEAHLS